MSGDLKVIAYIDTHCLNDADDIPMESWREDEKVPCYYLGAYEDSLDFLDENNEFAEEQREDPKRMFFVFNTIPDTLAAIEKAIETWTQ